MTRVLVFGSFDPLHEGHINFFEQARVLGDHLTVVVAHDEALSSHKGRDPHAPVEERMAAVAESGLADEVLIGSTQAGDYTLLAELNFDVIALGYDQEPADEAVREELDKRGKEQVRIVRLKPYRSDVYKSSRIRGDV